MLEKSSGKRKGKGRGNIIRVSGRSEDAGGEEAGDEVGQLRDRDNSKGKQNLKIKDQGL